MAENSEKHVSFAMLSHFKDKYDEKLASELEKKVAVVEGKGLSTNDFTNELKATLESALQADDLTDYAKKSDITTVFKYKGSKETYAELPTEDNEIGDTWNIATADSDHNVLAGDNVTWTGTAWDVLAGTVDLSPINTKIEQMEQDIITNSQMDFATTEDIDSLFA